MKAIKNILKSLSSFIIFLGLTLLTQTGGIIYLLSIPIYAVIKQKRRKKSYWTFTFLLLYAGINFCLVPLIAPLFGRVPLPIWQTNHIAPNAAYIYLLNRHYVKPALKESLFAVAKSANKQYPGLVLLYLDGNFPFLNGFPLLPHLSHNDGEKLDLAFVYKNKKTNKIAYGSRSSWLGYGICEEPQKNEQNQANECAEKGFWNYSLLKNIRLSTSSTLEADPTINAFVIKAFARDKAIGKLFLEPHLKKRWGLNSISKIRFHGCHAVRHDDHLHVQLH